jgi:hypothetical protein
MDIIDTKTIKQVTGGFNMISDYIGIKSEEIHKILGAQEVNNQKRSVNIQANIQKLEERIVDNHNVIIENQRIMNENTNQSKKDIINNFEEKIVEFEFKAMTITQNVTQSITKIGKTGLNQIKEIMTKNKTNLMDIENGIEANKKLIKRAKKDSEKNKTEVMNKIGGALRPSFPVFGAFWRLMKSG